MNRRGRRAAARKSQTITDSPEASTPAALYEAGLRHMRAGRYLDAQISMPGDAVRRCVRSDQNLSLIEGQR